MSGDLILALSGENQQQLDRFLDAAAQLAADTACRLGHEITDAGVYRQAFEDEPEMLMALLLTHALSDINRLANVHRPGTAH